MRLQIPDLVLILYLDCKLYPGCVTVMITLLMKFFSPPNSSDMTKFEGNGVSRTLYTTSGPHFTDGL